MFDSRPRIILASLCLLASSAALMPLTAAAQASPADKAMAEMLFDRGLSLMKQGQYESACAELERSQQVEGGIGTMLYLAECYERLGRTASAWALFREAASAARAEGQADRFKQGMARADKLEPQLSKLTVHVRESVPGLVVLRNGQPVPSSVFGSAVPMDPGEQRFEARADGYAPWSLTVELADRAGSVSVDIPALKPLPAAERVSPSEAAAQVNGLEAPAGGSALPLRAASASTSATTSHHSIQGPLGAVLGGAGIVGLGVGAYFGARAIAKNNAAEDACPGGRCSAQGDALDKQAHNAATLSNAFVIGGAAVLVGGAILYFTRPRERAPSVALQLSPRAAGVTVGGTL